MARRTIRLVGAAFIIVPVFVLLLMPVLSAQRAATQPEPDALRALLQEVHLLRTAIERAVLINSRMQLSLLRLDVEQERVAHLSGVLRGVQGELAAWTAEGRTLTQQLEDLVRWRRGAEPDVQREWDARRRQIERQLEEQRIREQQLRAQENDAIIALQAAEARLNDQNSRLDQIDQLLSEPPRRY